MSPSALRILTLLVSLLAVLACGDDDAASDFGGLDEPGPGGVFDTGSGGPDASVGADTEPDVFVPEEEEIELAIARPAASERYVFVANATLGSVAKIDNTTLAVTPIPVGDRPMVVRTIADGDLAVVLNVGSSTVTAINAGPVEDDVTTVDVLRGCNRLELSPGGRFALAWYDNRVAQSGDAIGSFQEVSAIDLVTLEAYDLSVGFNVRDVHFDAFGDVAYVVTESGVSVVALATLASSAIVPSVPFGEDAVVEETDREVQIAADGSSAVLRSSAYAGVRVVRLADGESVAVPLPAVPTDVDVLAGGDAIASLRDAGQIAVVDMDGAIAGEEGAVRLLDVDVPAGLLTLSADETTAFTYSTLDGERRLGVLDTAADFVGAARFLAKPVRAVHVSPDGARAVVVHTVSEGDAQAGEDVEDVVARSEAVTVYDTASGYAKLVLLETRVDEVVFSPDGAYVFLRLADERGGVREIVQVDLATFATHTYRLSNLPEAMGIIPGTNHVFVSERAAAGRITFIEPDTGTLRHVSAFELNAYID